MAAFWLAPFLLLLLLHPSEPAFSVGVGGGVGFYRDWSGTDTTTPDLTSSFKALQSWKSSITSDPSNLLSTWVGPNVCSYKGIFCSNSIITSIDLNRANLKGTLPSSLSLISSLSLLHLNSNRFHGSIPSSFKDLTSLAELDLSNNNFSGPFPAVALELPNLIYLDLRFNSFSGSLPDELFYTSLDAIFLNNNQFDGSLPESLGGSPASVINLANNKLTGPIPMSMGYSANTALKEVLLLNNELSGCIPQGVGLFSDIHVLDLSSNSLMGHLPDSISCLEDIEVLNLAHNKLSGEVPDLVCSLRSLMNLTVSYNFFSGYSQECSKMFFKSMGFDFSANCIPGAGGMQRPPPECSGVPGGGFDCMGIPDVKPLVCGTLLGGALANFTSLVQSP